MSSDRLKFGFDRFWGPNQLFRKHDFFHIFQFEKVKQLKFSKTNWNACFWNVLALWKYFGNYGPKTLILTDP